MKDKFRVKSVALGRVDNVVTKKLIAVTFEDDTVQVYKAVKEEKDLETNTVYLDSLQEVELKGTRINGFLFGVETPKDLPKPTFNLVKAGFDKHLAKLERTVQE